MKVALLIYLLGLFSWSALVAQEAPVAPTPEAHHVGVGSFYPLGSKENPVIADEYCAYLNEASCVDFDNKDNFYDGTFMNCDSKGWNLLGHCEVKEDDCITRHHKTLYNYSVVEGRGDFVIESLSIRSVGPDEEVNSVSFNNWRKNLTTEELCDYINDKIDNNEIAATALKSQHPEASAEIFSLAEFIAVACHNRGYCLQHNICEERSYYSHPSIECRLITFSSKGNESPEAPAYAVPVEAMKYYRPTSLKWE